LYWCSTGSPGSVLGGAVRDSNVNQYVQYEAEYWNRTYW
jgi:hypothetical protein